ncbi:MAG: sodium ion-translocating decarboxylase subunit beta [Chloroflexota bacterium]|nr:sodium ion-translocating decarboxylase subunit beta [Chloroflexota bacterium]
MEFLLESGFANLSWGNALLFLVGGAFMLLAIIKGMEPYVLLPIGLGIILGNLPETGLADFDPSGELQSSGLFGLIFHFTLSSWNILPPLIFLGLGALTDFGPIIANPKTLLLGAAAQLGIFVAFWSALGLGFLTSPDLFTLEEAGAIGIIGGADGPTTIFASAKLAPELLGITAVVAYSYMASVVFVQPPLMRLLTTQRERQIEMKTPRAVSRTEKLIFPTGAMLIIILFVPESAPLIAMFMIGNIFRESGVVPRLSNAASNEVLNIATIFLMITIGAELTAERVFDLKTLAILALGIVAFSCGTVGGLLFAKLMNLFVKEKVNPLIGSAGVSAVPMAARTAHNLGQQANPSNYLLPHAMGPNVAGVIGSAVVAGVFISILG